MYMNICVVIVDTKVNTKFSHKPVFCYFFQLYLEAGFNPFPVAIS